MSEGCGGMGRSTASQRYAHGSTNSMFCSSERPKLEPGICIGGTVQLWLIIARRAQGKKPGGARLASIVETSMPPIGTITLNGHCED